VEKYMTDTEREAAAALRASMGINQAQQALTDESRVLLAALLRDEMRVAVAEGIGAALTDEAAERFWAKGLEVLQRQAKQKAGGFLLAGVIAASKRLMWIGVFLMIAWSVGGWTLLKTVWAAIAPKG
jgi:hypothetical protein